MRKAVVMTVAGGVVLGVCCFGGASVGPASVSANMVMEDAGKQEQGYKHKLGRREIGGYIVSVIVIGEVEAGKPVDFDIKLINAKDDPKALRAWVGLEDSKEKAQGTKGATTYTGQIAVPNPLPENAKLWVEIETSAGVSKGSFELDKHDHKH